MASRNRRTNCTVLHIGELAMRARDPRKKNPGTRLTAQQRQVVATEIRGAPFNTDAQIAELATERTGRLVDRSTVNRIRKEIGAPSSGEAIANLPTPLSESDANRLRRLLDRLFVPGLDECGWRSGESRNGSVLRLTRRGSLLLHRDNGRTTRTWLNSNEESELKILISGHLGQIWKAWAVNRYERLSALVARQLDRIQAHDFAYKEGMETDSLIALRSYLDSGMRPGPRTSGSESFKLIFRHPRLMSLVDGFVAWIRATLKL